jgi:hypothetical protein
MKIRFGSLKYDLILTGGLESVLQSPVNIPQGAPWRGVKIDEELDETTWYEGLQLGILSTHLLMPTLEKWGEAIKNGSYEILFPAWKRFRRTFPDLVIEIEAAALKWGMVNGLVVDEHQIMALIRTAFMQTGGMSLGMLQSS